MLKIFVNVVIILFLASCSKQEAGDYQLRYNHPFIIQAGSGTLLTYVIEFTQPTGWNVFLSNNLLSTEDIDRIHVRNISISPILGAEINYGFIEEVKVFITNPSDRNSKIQIGYENPLPNEETRNLFLFPGIADLLSYISNSSVTFTIELRYRQIITSNTNHDLQIELDVFKK